MQDGRLIYFIMFIIQTQSVVNKISQTNNSPYVPFFPQATWKGQGKTNPNWVFLWIMNWDGPDCLGSEISSKIKAESLESLNGIWFNV